MIWSNGILENGSLNPYPEVGDKGLIYEVMRVIDSTPVFFHEHLKRFLKAAELTGTVINFDEEILLNGFFEVIRENNISEGNIRLQADLSDGRVKIGVISHQYPGISDYQLGVDVELTDLQRINPEIKTWNKPVRKAADDIIREKKIHEVILTSPEGFLLEGSRSNIFGLKKGILISPPANYILPGITRQIIIDSAKKNNIPFEESHIHKAELFSYQSFFLTGTSPGILPIRSIGSVRFSCESSPCAMLRNSYEERVRESISKTGGNL